MPWKKSRNYSRSRLNTIANVTAYHRAKGLPFVSPEEISRTFDRIWDEAEKNPNIQYHEGDDDLF